MAIVGITRFSVQPIKDVNDTNRQYLDRADAIVNLAYGSHWRLHPGLRPSSDVRPENIRAMSRDIALP